MSTKVWMGGWELAGKASLVIAASLVCAAATYKSDPAFMGSFVFTALIWYLMMAGSVAVYELAGRALGLGLERLFGRRTAAREADVAAPGDGDAIR